MDILNATITLCNFQLHYEYNTSYFHYVIKRIQNKVHFLKQIKFHPTIVRNTIYIYISFFNDCSHFSIQIGTIKVQNVRGERITSRAARSRWLAKSNYRNTYSVDPTIVTFLFMTFCTLLRNSTAYVWLLCCWFHNNWSFNKRWHQLLGLKLL